MGIGCFIRRGRKGELGCFGFGGGEVGKKGGGRPFCSLVLFLVCGRADRWSIAGWCSLRRGDEHGGE